MLIHISRVIIEEVTVPYLNQKHSAMKSTM